MGRSSRRADRRSDARLRGVEAVHTSNRAAAVAIERCGDPDANVVETALGDDGVWTVTLTGEFKPRQSGPIGRRSQRPSGCTRAQVRFPSDAPDDWYTVEWSEPTFE